MRLTDLSLYWRVAVVCFVLSTSALAQNEKALQDYFEGRQVVVRIDMPGSSDGVDIYPQQETPIDYRALGDHLKAYGIALRKGDSVMVTKVHLKGKLIEFQLGGGGFGTLGDYMQEKHGPSTSVSKSQRELDLEKERKNTTDPDRLRDIDRELDYLARQRAREEAQRRQESSEVEAANESERIGKRLHSGSRFNVRYKKEVPEEAKTPEGVIAALREYVSFSPEGAPQQSSAGYEQAAPPQNGTTQRAMDPVAVLHKGMQETEVEQTLGAPSSKNVRSVDGMTVDDCMYLQQSTRVAARFVNGVLTEFTVSSR